MESYSDQYERLRGTGVKPAVRFFPIHQTNIMTEEYRFIEDIHIAGIVPKRYMISNFGNIIDNYTGTFVNQTSDKDGYKCISLILLNGYKKVRVHRIMMIVFCYRPDYQKLQANHIDGDNTNNFLYNLEWTTPKENSDHAMLYGLHEMNGSKNPNSVLSEDQVKEICKMIESGKYYDTEIAKKFGVSNVTISDIHKGKIWRTVSKDYNIEKRKPRKLDSKQVHEICKLLEEGKYFTTEIAKMYNTSYVNVRDIRDGKIWKEIGKNYNMKPKSRKFTKEKVREICKVLESGKYYDTEIAKMYNTTPTFLYSLRNNLIHTDITKDFDMTVRKGKPKTVIKG